MSMCHKAFVFDWIAFERAFRSTLEDAIRDSDQKALADYIERHRAECRDPYEGDPLPEDWTGLLEVGDAQELADFALTRYYSPAEDFGVGELWPQVDSELPEDARRALLGFAIGSTTSLFDPGRTGSYFQTPEMVGDSLSILANYSHEETATYLQLLRQAIEGGFGVYVTF